MESLVRHVASGAFGIVVLLPSTIALSWLVTVGVSSDGAKTFVHAYWLYPQEAAFDNSWPTWSTDYLLALICCYFIRAVERADSKHPPSHLRIHATQLFKLYALSVFLGGAVHQQHSGNLSELNSLRFRIAWTIVVGATAAAGGCFGAIGSELLRLSNSRVQLPSAAWATYSLALFALVAGGHLSCVRPAGDVFVAGSSQAMPTFFLQSCAFVWRHSTTTHVPPLAFWVLQLSLVTNAPLVFLYPVLIQRSGLPLSAINAALHTWLAVSWAAQGWSLSVIVRAIELGRKRSS